MHELIQQMLNQIYIGWTYFLEFKCAIFNSTYMFSMSVHSFRYIFFLLSLIIETGIKQYSALSEEKKKN